MVFKIKKKKRKWRKRKFKKFELKKIECENAASNICNLFHFHRRKIFISIDLI